MSTKTSSGVPKVIILATLAVLATSAVVQHVRVGRCDGHHEMIDLDSRNGGLSNLAHHRRD